MQGLWQVTTAGEFGQEPAAQLEGATVVIRGDRITLKEAGWIFLLNPKKKPKWIDLTLGDGPLLPGIYQVDGDVLKICFNAQPGGDRPTRFASEPHRPADVLLLCKRAEP
jgi:uncharacterized protein (TIGR03067 family)